VNATRQFDGLERASLPARPLHLAIGMFDGVHLGHRAVIDMAIQSARRSGGLAGVLTFWPHPSALFDPANATRLIAGPDLRARLLGETGVEFVITQPFTPQFASIEAEAVLPFLKKNLPTLAAVYVGENWRFGKGRRGDITLLVSEGRKQHVTVVSAQRINHNGEPISSTRIRACLEAGELEEANALFGYTYFAEGIVAAGKKLGRTIGFPTLNIPWEPSLRPRFGVYAVRVSGPKSSEPIAAVANYGVRPTVEQGAQPRIEAHLLETCPFGEGDAVRVEWLTFLRPEMKFSGVSELTAQIAKDREEAARYFRS
jgi:riboflavin kinase / FMN adenylyltransferase